MEEHAICFEMGELRVTPEPMRPAPGQVDSPRTCLRVALCGAWIAAGGLVLQNREIHITLASGRCPTAIASALTEAWRRLARHFVPNRAGSVFTARFRTADNGAPPLCFDLTSGPLMSWCAGIAGEFADTTALGFVPHAVYGSPGAGHGSAVAFRALHLSIGKDGSSCVHVSPAR